jgi:hypothetical protein
METGTSIQTRNRTMTGLRFLFRVSSRDFVPGRFSDVGQSPMHPRHADVRETCTVADVMADRHGFGRGSNPSILDWRSRSELKRDVLAVKHTWTDCFSGFELSNRQ